MKAREIPNGSKQPPTLLSIFLINQIVQVAITWILFWHMKGPIGSSLVRAIANTRNLIDFTLGQAPTEELIIESGLWGKGRGNRWCLRRIRTRRTSEQEALLWTRNCARCKGLFRIQAHRDHSPSTIAPYGKLYVNHVPSPLFPHSVYFFQGMI